MCIYDLPTYIKDKQYYHNVIIITMIQFFVFQGTREKTRHSLQPDSTLLIISSDCMRRSKRDTYISICRTHFGLVGYFLWFIQFLTIYLSHLFIHLFIILVCAFWNWLQTDNVFFIHRKHAVIKPLAYWLECQATRPTTTHLLLQYYYNVTSITWPLCYTLLLS